MGLKKPKIARSANIVKEAVVFGDVEIKEGASVLFYSVIRGDRSKITVGKYSNIQDNCTLHSDPEYPLTVGHCGAQCHPAWMYDWRWKSCGDGSDCLKWCSNWERMPDWCGKSDFARAGNTRQKSCDGKPGEGKKAAF